MVLKICTLAFKHRRGANFSAIAPVHTSGKKLYMYKTGAAIGISLQLYEFLHICQRVHNTVWIIRALVDALCEDGTGKISHLHPKLLKMSKLTQQKHLPKAKNFCAYRQSIVHASNCSCHIFQSSLSLIWNQLKDTYFATWCWCSEDRG